MSSTVENRRLLPRFPVELPITVGWEKRREEALAVDVSSQGVYIATSHAIPLRQLVQLVVELPHEADDPTGGDQELTVTAMVVHATETERGPGIGLELYANDAQATERWNTWVEHARQEYRKEGPARGSQTIGTVLPSRRGSERFAAILEIRTGSSADLLDLYTLNVSTGGMFICTDADLALGSEILVDFVHPESSKTVNILAVVVHKHPQDGHPGIGVQFMDMTDKQRELFLQFAQK